MMSSYSTPGFVKVISKNKGRKLHVPEVPPIWNVSVIIKVCVKCRKNSISDFCKLMLEWLVITRRSAVGSQVQKPVDRSVGYLHKELNMEILGFPA
jgi:hypothetical protein